MVVLSRTVGMVLALAALTAFGLARFQRIFVGLHCDTVTGGSLREQVIAHVAHTSLLALARHPVVHKCEEALS